MAPYREFTYTEWSTHANFLTASFYGAGIREFEPERHVVGVYDWERGAWTPVARGAASHHLWVRETPAEVMNSEQQMLRGYARFWEDHVPRPPRAWPADTEGLIFGWENANQPARVLDGAGNHALDVAYEFTPHGRVRYTRDGAMRLEGGEFSADGLGDIIRRAMRRDGEISIEMRVRPDADTFDTPAPFFYLGPDPHVEDGAHAIVLGQSGDRLIWRASPPTVRERRGDEVSFRPGRSTHVVLELGPGRWSVEAGDYGYGGVIAHSPAVQVDPARLVVGSPNWRGTIEAVAIYARFGPALAENAADYARHAAMRPRVSGSSVTARLRMAPVLPDPSQSAYKRAWAAFEYDVEQVHSGDVPLGRILVARYVWMDGEKLPAAHAQSGDRHELHLEPYEANSQIHSERQFHLDDVDFDMPMFYDVGPLTED